VWRQGLARGCDEAGVNLTAVGLAPEDLPPTADDHNSPRTIKLDDGEVLSVGEVLRRCTDPAELGALRDVEHDDSHFHWLTVVNQLARHLDRAQVDEVAALFEGDSEEAFVLVRLGECLLELGYGEDALDLAQRAFRASNPRGWDHYYDGGTRLKAAQLILTIDAPAARRAVIDSLVDDLLSEFWWPTNLAMGLRDVVALMTENVPVLELWGEIQEHTQALFRDVELPDVDMADNAPDLPDDTPGYALAHLVAAHVDHHCLAVLEAAHRTCGQLLLKRDTCMQEAVRGLLVGTESHQRHTLVILDAASLQDAGVVSVFRDEVGVLAGGPNYAISTAARAICGRIGWPLPADAGSHAGLPAIYALALPPAGVPRDDQRLVPEPGEPMPDFSDPLVMVQPFVQSIDMLADITGLPFTNICHRVAAIMRELRPQEEWSADAERRLRGRLEAMGLRFAFRRPRAAMVRQAMFRAVSEIVDAGPVPVDALAALDRVLRYHDPAMLFVDPREKPTEVAPLAGGDEHGHFRAEWPSQGAASIALVSRQTGNDWTVLAEHTELRGLDRPGPRETRRSCVHPRSTLLVGPEEEYDTICGTTFERLVAEYHALDREWEPIHLIIQNGDLGFLTPGGRWLALNPSVARDLGWRPSDEALLAWADDEGRLMVQTVWWRDGQPDARSYARDEVGEGWLVLASSEALSTMQDALGDLRRAVVVERSLGEGDRTPQSADALADL